SSSPTSSALTARRISVLTRCVALNAAPCGRSRAAAPPRLGAIARSAPPVAPSGSRTTRVGTVTVRNASGWPPSAGSPRAAARSRWIAARPGFRFPVRALTKVFRGRYLAGLRRAFDRGELHCTGGLAALAEPAAVAAWLDELRQQAWVVYCKPPFAGPEH